MSTVSKLSCAGYCLLLYTRAQLSLPYAYPMRTAHLEVKLPVCPKDRDPHMDPVMLAQVGPSIVRLLPEYTSTTTLQNHPAKSHGSWDLTHGTECLDTPYSRFLHQDWIIKHLLLFFFPQDWLQLNVTQCPMGVLHTVADNNQMSPESSLICYGCLGS